MRARDSNFLQYFFMVKKILIGLSVLVNVVLIAFVVWLGYFYGYTNRLDYIVISDALDTRIPRFCQEFKAQLNRTPPLCEFYDSWLERQNTESQKN